jgi:hypothetical protein
LGAFLKDVDKRKLLSEVYYYWHMHSANMPFTNSEDPAGDPISTGFAILRDYNIQTQTSYSTFQEPLIIEALASQYRDMTDPNDDLVFKVCPFVYSYVTLLVYKRHAD